MSRLTNAILEGQAYSRGVQTSVLDASYGGQFGYSPNLTELVSNQAYVRKPLVCILLEAPKFFQLMPNPYKWVQTLKSMFELHARTWEGFNGGLTVDFDEHPVGGGGEMQQEVIDIKRARSEPVWGGTEKYGMPFQRFIYNWITYGMGDPETKYALAGTLANPPSDLLMDWTSATALFFEPDPTHTRVMKSWITANMMPKGTGEIVGKRDLTSSMEILQLSIEFTGVSQFNLGTDVFAQQILDNINLINANPLLKPAFIQSMDPDVAAAGEEGYIENIERMSAEALDGGANVNGSGISVTANAGVSITA
jgi:hypothetical protein